MDTTYPIIRNQGRKLRKYIEGCKEKRNEAKKKKKRKRQEPTNQSKGKAKQD